MKIAAAGPLLNFVVAGIVSGILVLTDGFGRPGLIYQLLRTLVWINVMLGGFNLLPAFPMDGGRVLRALLARRLSYVRATDLAATIGRGMAVLFGIAGLLLAPSVVWTSITTGSFLLLGALLAMPAGFFLAGVVFGKAGVQIIQRTNHHFLGQYTGDDADHCWPIVLLNTHRCKHGNQRPTGGT